MGTDVGLKLSIGGEAAFKSSLQAINSQIRNLNSEMKAVISGFTGMDSAEEKSASKMGVLSRQAESAKQKLSILEAEYKKQTNSEKIVLKLEGRRKNIMIKHELSTISAGR